MDIKEYIRQFQEMANTDDKNSRIGTVPQYPFLVCFMDSLSAAGYSVIRNHLVSLWPPFENDMMFLQMDSAEQFTDMQGKQMHVSEMLRETIPTLLRVGSPYPDVSRLRVYAVLDTTDKTAEDFIGALEKARVLLEKLKTYNVNLILFTLLDDVGNRAECAKIRNYLAGQEMRAFPVYLLSNRMYGNHVIGNWKICWQAIASAIAVSNSQKSAVPSFYTPEIKTLGYFREGKPSEEIAQISVCGLIQYLQDVLSARREEITLPGITKGHIDILDQYVDRRTDALLSAEMLQLLPRTEMRPVSEQDSYESVNELTMQSLDYLQDCILEEVLECIRKESRMKPVDLVENSRFAAAFLKGLEGLHFMDILQLTSNVASLKEMLVPRGTAFTGTSVGCISVFREHIKHKLAVHEEVHAFFVQMMLAAKANVEEIHNSYQSLLYSRNSLHKIQDQGLETYYKQLLQRYLEKNPADVELRRCNTLDRLHRFMGQLMENLIQSHSIYRYDLERERNERLNDESGGSVAMNTTTMVRNVLAREINIMFPNSGSVMREPKGKFIFAVNEILARCELQGSDSDCVLKDTDIHVYKTGCNFCVDILYLYNIENTALVTQEEV